MVIDANFRAQIVENYMIWKCDTPAMNISCARIGEYNTILYMVVVVVVLKMKNVKYWLPHLTNKAMTIAYDFGEYDSPGYFPFPLRNKPTITLPFEAYWR